MQHILKFSGEYDLSCKEELRARLDALHHEPEVILDLSEVTYLDSSVLGELAWLHDVRTKNGLPKEILVISVGSVVERLFGIVGMGPLFRIVSSLGDIGDINEDCVDSDFTCFS